MSDDPTHREGPLEGWKEISAFLNRDESTARRWEREEGLPVRRHAHKKRSSVYAYPRELEAWRAARGPERARPFRGSRRTSGWATLAAAALILLSGGDGFRSIAEAHDPEGRTPSPTMTVRELMRTGGGREGGNANPAWGVGSSFAVSGDGRTLVFTDWRTGDLSVTDLATGDVRGLFGVDWRRQSDEWFENPVLSPDDKQVAFVRYPNQAGGTTRIEVGSVEGGSRRTVHDFHNIVTASTHDWNPDGESILLSSQADDRSVFLATLSLKDKTLRRLLTLDWEAPRRRTGASSPTIPRRAETARSIS